MRIVPFLHRTSLAITVTAAMIALPALAQTQNQQQPQQPAAGAQQATGIYSGPQDAAAKRSPDSDCKSPNASMGAKSPEQLQRALEASKSPTYSGTAADEAAKQAAATCN